MAHRATLEKLMRLTLGPLLCVPGFGVICESTFWANGGVPVRFLVLAVGFTLPRTFRTHMVVGVPWFRGPDPLVRVAFGLHGLALEPRGPWDSQVGSLVSSRRLYCWTHYSRTSVAIGNAPGVDAKGG